MNKKDFGYNTDCCCLTDREINQILMKENQALKERWQKLKEFIITNKNSMFLNDMPTTRMYLTKVLDKMQELEDRQ